MATFRQTTSRADDPQVHTTHAVISAKVQTEDRRWWALDARYLKRNQRMLGGVYQSVLRAELTDRYGVGWEPIVNGQAERAGTAAELLEVFSKRAVQVDAALAVKVDEFRARQGRDPTRWERAALCREASADTRRHKSGVGVPDLRTRWESEAPALVGRPIASSPS
jgi:conjugative relaxase-like TrwC/TraI family protein